MVIDRAPTEPETEPGRRWSRRLYPAAVGAALGLGLFAVGFRGILDDGHITMAYAQNLAEHFHWGLTRYRTSNTATSPLNVWLIALGILITGSGTVGVGLVLVGSTTATAVWLSAVARRAGLSPLVLPALAVGMLVTSPLFASTIGMETFLSIAVLTGVARYAMAGRPVATGLLCGFAVLTRPDLAVPAAVLALGLLVLASTCKVQTTGVVVGVGLATVLPWHLLSWVVLGGAVPDTYAIKSAAGSFAGGDTFFTGPWHMIHAWTHATLLVAVPLVVALAGVAWWALSRPRPAAARLAFAFAAAGVAHWLAYAAVGVPPYHWYYCPAVGLLCVSAAVTVTALGSRIAVLATVLFIGLTAGSQLAGPVPWVEPVIYGNWGTPAQYAAMGRAVGTEVPKGAPVAGYGEVGALAYYCDCDVVNDPFADRASAAPIIADRYEKAGRLGRWLLDLNYAFNDRRQPPTRPQYQLVYTRGPGPGWRVDGPAIGQGHIELVPAG
ncbi:hypothetical protein [Amycolatopsis sp. GM8]|uniref:hypothetical protein n=1 Tax=Amycolatopsis sp. GM8 TaxID=2896530 RepID=UPI001F3A35FB|nr:hypothetical protein [Amycolatopsis sp. GM8]